MDKEYAIKLGEMLVTALINAIQSTYKESVCAYSDCQNKTIIYSTGIYGACCCDEHERLYLDGIILGESKCIICGTLQSVSGSCFSWCCGNDYCKKTILEKSKVCPNIKQLMLR